MQADQPNTLEIRELEQSTFGVLYEFYVDGESLAQKVGIADRPQCLEFSSGSDRQNFRDFVRCFTQLFEENHYEVE